MTKKSKKSTSRYTEVINDLIKKLKEAENDKEKLELYKEFSQNYLMPRDFWFKRRRLEDSVGEKQEKIENVVYNFCYEFYWPNIKKFREKLLDNRGNFQSSPNNKLYNKHHPLMIEISQRLKVPSMECRELFIWYEQHASSPVSIEFKKNVEKMEKLFSKITEATDDLEMWMEYLVEANDHEFVKQNVENQIGQNLGNKKLWKLYIEYLRENDATEMLQVYSKYCRFFLDDFEMKNQYKNAVEKYGPVYVRWKNLFDFELLYPPPKTTFKFSKQLLSFPQPLINFIVDKADSILGSKIQQTCKYLCYKNGKFYCYRFMCTARPDTKFHEESLLLNIENAVVSLKPYENHKLVLTNTLEMVDVSSKSFLSELIQNYIYECHVKYINVYHQNISEQELKFLIGQGNVEYFDLNCCQIAKENGELILLEEILIMLPNIRSFKYQTPPNEFLNTANKLSHLKFNYKIIAFHLNGINNEIEGNDFCLFVKKNIAPFAMTWIFFNENFDQTLIQNLRNSIVYNLMNKIQWYQRPNFWIR